MPARLANPHTTDDPTTEPLRSLLARLAELEPALDAIDLDVDLNERDTYSLMVALGVSASSGDPQLIGDRWIKLGVHVERGVLTTEQWLELHPAVAWRDSKDREEGRLPEREEVTFAEYVSREEWERRQRARSEVRKRLLEKPSPP